MIPMKRARLITLLILLTTMITPAILQPAKATAWSTSMHLALTDLDRHLDYTVSLTYPSTLHTEEEETLVLQVHVDDVSPLAFGLTSLQAIVSVKLPNGYELTKEATAPQDYYGKDENWIETLTFYFSDQQAELNPGSTVTAQITVLIRDAMKYRTGTGSIAYSTPTWRNFGGPTANLYSPIPATLLVTNPSIAITTGKDAVYEGDPFRFSAVVKNVGERTAKDIYVTLKLPPSLTAEEPLTKVLGELNVNESKTIIWNIKTSASGNYEIEVDLSSSTAKSAVDRFNVEIKPGILQPYLPFLVFGILAAIVIIVPIIILEGGRPKYK